MAYQLPDICMFKCLCVGQRDVKGLHSFINFRTIADEMEG